MKIVLLGVSKVVSWLVLIGVNECILIKVQIAQNSGKTNTFLILWAFLLGSMSAFTQKLCLSGLGYGDSLAVPEICVFLGLNLRVLWSKVTNNFAVPKICVLGELSCWGHNLE